MEKKTQRARFAVTAKSSKSKEFAEEAVFKRKNSGRLEQVGVGRQKGKNYPS